MFQTVHILKYIFLNKYCLLCKNIDQVLENITLSRIETLRYSCFYRLFQNEDVMKFNYLFMCRMIFYWMSYFFF